MSTSHKRWRIALVAAIIAVGLAGAAVWGYGRWQTPTFRGLAISPPYPAPDFVLTDQHGQPFQLAALRGRPVLVFFGYTFCPDVCPGTMVQYRAVRQALGADADRVGLLFVTVDPERDTPERLAEYVGHFDAAIVGLTGSPATVEHVMHRWGVFAEKVPVPGSATGYLINHTAALYLVGPDGMVRVMHPYGTPTADIVHDVRGLLRQSAGSAPARVLVRDAWARPAASGDTSAVYLTLVNPTQSPDRLLEVRTDVARATEIHETRMEGDVMRMEPVHAVEVPARGEAVLRPGGLHIMLVGLERNLRQGDRVSVVLRFERAGEVPADVPVRQQTS
ncbi:SCO family protein [Geochorda subterranea]|uniref:SCO family protein n=1 Tax=Geochorda subterranea TaxID=3109564 RepID=A0ABZ1BPM6_9FIRM|nr:SCO family protein [Limnochorda sp. LNt]WRP14742.1 SCO family protein [Limnochorda sp. LNt]